MTWKCDPRIYITGASCAGVTTLGAILARDLEIRHLDVDDFFWAQTDPPYMIKRPIAERISLLLEAQAGTGWVLSGAFDAWGDSLIAQVDLIVFVLTPGPERMRRLAAREQARHGDRIAPDGDMHEAHKAFVEWASCYDKPEFSGRNRTRHEAWLSRQSAPILRLDGVQPSEYLAAEVFAALT